MNPLAAPAPKVSCRYQSSSLKSVTGNDRSMMKGGMAKPSRQLAMVEIVPVHVEGMPSNEELERRQKLSDEIVDLKEANVELASNLIELRKVVKGLTEESSDLKSKLAKVKPLELNADKVFKLEADKLVANREKALLEETVNGLRKELEELRTVHQKLQAEYDVIKIDPVKVKRAAVAQLAEKLLEDKTEDQAMRKIALGFCLTRNKESLEKDAQDRFYAELTDAFKNKALKNFLAVHPGLQPEVEEQLLTLMRGDLLLKANLQAQLKRELKDEIIRKQCDEILAVERAAAEAKQLKYDLEQDEYVKKKREENRKLRQDNERLEEDLRRMKDNRKRERSRSRDSRRR